MLTADIISKTASTIEIKYKFKNSRSTPLYVFDELPIFHSVNEKKTNHNKVYIINENGNIYIGKFIIPIPEGIKAESPEIPYLFMLKPKEVLQYNIKLTRPVETNHPYIGKEDIEELIIKKDFILQIGFIDDASINEDEAVVEPIDNKQRNLFRCDYGYGFEYQEVENVVLSLT